MFKPSQVLSTLPVLAGFSFLALAQTGPQLTVGPGLIYTIASRATNGLSLTAFNGVAFKSPGTVYVSDAHSESNSQGSSVSLANVYVIDLTSGQVTRVAGTAPDHTNGNIADCVSGTTASCPGDGGLATNAQLHEPSGLALDSGGNLFIADARQNVIRRVDASTGIITTAAGTGSSGPGCNACAATQANLSFPTGIAFDGANNLYIADTLNNRVRVITSANGLISTIAGTTAGFGGDGGSAVNAQLNQPLGIAVDRLGNIFIADAANNAIREISSGNIQTVAGQGAMAGYTGDGGAATSATLHYPRGIAVDAGENLYIADNNNNAIRKVTGDSIHMISTVAGNNTAGYSGDGGPALTASLRGPSSIVVDGQSNLYFVDNQFAAVRRILSTAAPMTVPLTAVGATGTAPYPLTVSNTGDQLLTIAAITFPTNFSAGLGGTCPAGAFSLNPGASCTLPVNFAPISGGSTAGTLVFTSNTGNGTSATTNVTLSESNGLYFVPVTPCRVIETRVSDPNFGGPAYSAGEIRSYAIRNSNTVGCASAPIPAGADVQAYSLNVTVVPRGALSFLIVYPSGTARPGVSTLNSYDGRTKANAVIVPANLSDSNRSISIYANDTTDVIVDINGYYVPEASSPSTTNGQTPLAFYPLPPCRSVDTRPNTGLLGAGSPLLGGSPADYALAGTCSLPRNAQAYALNYTAVPRNGPLNYLTTWPTNTTRPVVSTLNATTGAVTANAAIVPAGANGSVSVFSTADVDLIIDVAGYYAPPATSGLALYTVSPCRAFDTRNTGNGAPINGVYSENVGGSCSVPATAQSYVVNATVIPPQNGSLSYLSGWALGSAQPVQSILNAYDGAVTSNLAVVPTINGYVSTYAAAPTGLLLDLSAYFAP